MKNIVFFDLDATIVESKQSIVYSFNQIFKKKNNFFEEN